MNVSNSFASNHLRRQPQSVPNLNRNSNRKTLPNQNKNNCRCSSLATLKDSLLNPSAFEIFAKKERGRNCRNYLWFSCPTLPVRENFFTPLKNKNQHRGEIKKDFNVVCRKFHNIPPTQIICSGTPAFGREKSLGGLSPISLVF